MKPRPFRQVDVFSRQPYLGNPLAVVLDGSDLTDQQMQDFARWTNLSETTFVLPPLQPEADYRVRIFTTVRELPFAGHPTLGTCHAWLQAGGRAKSAHQVVQECAAGLIPIRRDGERLAFGAPPLIRSGPVDAALLEQTARCLGIARSDILHHQWVDNGPGWMAVMLRSADQVLSLTPDFAHLEGAKLGVVGAYPAGSAQQFELRAFIALGQVIEDPVTGSLNASVAQWLIGAGLAPTSYIASQGRALGRAGRVHIDRDANGQVWVGGHSVTCIDGCVTV